MASSGMRLINDPEGLNRVVIEYYEDNEPIVRCYLAPGTKFRDADMACRRLMENCFYGGPYEPTQVKTVL